MNKQDFSEIYLDYFESLCLYAYRFFPEKEEAHDIVQEVMVKIWEKKESLPPIGNMEAYLYRAVYHGCLNKLEKLKVRDKYADRKRIRLLEIELESFEETFFQWELREKINDEVSKLSSQEKKIFTMRYLQSKRYKEIATLLNISERTVETHIQNATKKLRAGLINFR